MDQSAIHFNFDQLRERDWKKSIVFVNPDARCRGLIPYGQPLSLQSLMGVCRDLGIPYGFIDGNGWDWTAEQVIAEINNKGYDYIGVTMVSMKAPAIFPFLERLKRETGATLIAGGVLPTMDTKWFMESCPSVDYSVLGEGEIALPRLLHAIEEKRSMVGLPGVAFRQNGELIVNPTTKQYLKGAEIPMPDFTGVDYSFYPGTHPVGAWPSVNIFTNRGCPFKCGFCNNLWLRPISLVPVPRVIEWLEVLAGMGVREVYFVDDTLNVNRKWLAELCHALIAADFPGRMIFKCHMRADLVSLEQLLMARKAGFWIINYGAESGDAAVMDYYTKGETIDEIAQAIEVTRQAGLSSLASFIVGAPMDTHETMRKTCEFIKQTDPTYSPVNIYHPFIGNPVTDDIIRLGILTEDQVRNYDGANHTIRTLHLSTQDLLDGVKMIRREVLAYKKSPERSRRRRLELGRAGLAHDRIEKIINYEMREAEYVKHSTIPRTRLFTGDDRDMEWMSSEINLASADIRLRDGEWHESEKTLRWSQPEFELPFFLKEKSQEIEISWAAMRKGVEVELTVNGIKPVSLKVTDPGWRSDRVTLPDPIEGPTWLRMKVKKPFRAPNDPRELGMAFKQIRFV
jgi:anaerobic magnesium-protoporphyrin IX monomethyl ester cyclase